MRRLKSSTGSDFTYSLGFSVGEDGKLADVIVGSPAYQAGLGPRMQLIAVNGRKWTPAVLEAALRASKGTDQAIELIVENGQNSRPIRSPITTGKGIRTWSGFRTSRILSWRRSETLVPLGAGGLWYQSKLGCTSGAATINSKLRKQVLHSYFRDFRQSAPDSRCCAGCPHSIVWAGSVRSVKILG